MTELSHIRNFSIVAHIDHGKSTLADRLIQSMGTVKDRDMKEQLTRWISNVRGASPPKPIRCALNMTQSGERYILNLIDTPGHVDLYEVSHSMCGRWDRFGGGQHPRVEAQTLANVYQAIDADHEIVPVLNK